MLVHIKRQPDCKQLNDLRRRVETLREKNKTLITYMIAGYTRFTNKALTSTNIMRWIPQEKAPWAIQNKINEAYVEADYQFTHSIHAVTDYIHNYVSTTKDLASASDQLLVLESIPIVPVEIKFTTEELEARYPSHIRSASYDPSLGVLTIRTQPLIAKLNVAPDATFTSVTNELVIPPLKFYVDLNRPEGSLGNLRFFPINFSYNNTFTSEAPHPHILQNGKPCLGDYQTVISDAFDSGDIDTFLTVVFSFLEQVNADDDQAGNSWPNMFIQNKEVWKTLTSGEFDIRDMSFTFTKKVSFYE